MQLELEINQPLLAHNSQLIAAQGEAIKGFGQKRLFTWRLRPARTASPKGSPGLTATKYAGGNEEIGHVDGGRSEEPSRMTRTDRWGRRERNLGSGARWT
jgi:hypothetical protein